MSVDLKRCQELAEALKWSIWYGNTATVFEPEYIYKLFDAPKGTGGNVITSGATLTPIRARLEAEYRKLAEQAQNARRVYLKISNWCGGDTSDEATYLTRIADEFAVNEPTMVERLREVRRRTDRPVAKAIEVIADAIIDLYERKEK